MSDSRKLGLSEDWAVVPFLSLTMLGFAATVYDFTVIQGLGFQLSPLSLLGLAMLVFGGYLRLMSRRQLMRAGLTMLGSSRLVIAEGQRLVTDGLYRRIRHPLYLGEITRNLGFTLILTSGYGCARGPTGRAECSVRRNLGTTVLTVLHLIRHISLRDTLISQIKTMT